MDINPKDNINFKEEEYTCENCGKVTVKIIFEVGGRELFRQEPLCNLCWMENFYDSKTIERKLKRGTPNEIY